MIARGTGNDWTTDTVDSEMALGDTHEHYYHDQLSSLPRGRSLGRAPWPVASTTLEMEQAVDTYLSGKPLAEQIGLSRFMAALEYELPPVRSRTTTLDAPWLRIPGASVAIRQQWHERLEGGAK